MKRQEQTTWHSREGSIMTISLVDFINRRLENHLKEVGKSVSPAFNRFLDLTLFTEQKGKQDESGKVVYHISNTFLNEGTIANLEYLKAMTAEEFELARDLSMQMSFIEYIRTHIGRSEELRLIIKKLDKKELLTDGELESLRGAFARLKEGALEESRKISRKFDSLMETIKKKGSKKFNGKANEQIKIPNVRIRDVGLLLSIHIINFVQTSYSASAAAVQPTSPAKPADTPISPSASTQASQDKGSAPGVGSPTPPASGSTAALAPSVPPSAPSSPAIPSAVASEGGSSKGAPLAPSVETVDSTAPSAPPHSTGASAAAQSSSPTPPIPSSIAVLVPSAVASAAPSSPAIPSAVASPAPSVSPSSPMVPPSKPLISPSEPSGSQYLNPPSLMLDMGLGVGSQGITPGAVPATHSDDSDGDVMVSVNPQDGRYILIPSFEVLSSEDTDRSEKRPWGKSCIWYTLINPNIVKEYRLIEKAIEALDSNDESLLSKTIQELKVINHTMYSPLVDVTRGIGFNREFFVNRLEVLDAEVVAQRTPGARIIRHDVNKSKTNSIADTRSVSVATFGLKSNDTVRVQLNSVNGAGTLFVDVQLDNEGNYAGCAFLNLADKNTHRKFGECHVSNGIDRKVMAGIINGLSDGFFVNGENVSKYLIDSLEGRKFDRSNTDDLELDTGGFAARHRTSTDGTVSIDLDR